MIKCYKDPTIEKDVVVEFQGDGLEITSDFVCIASKMLHSGIPMKILRESLEIADKYKGEWKKNDKS